MEWQSRTELLLGKDKQERLKNANVLVVGLGGVGSYAVEQLVRAGIGNLLIIDGDSVHPSNRNRQLPALISTENLPKATVMEQRIKDINPDINLHIIQDFIKDKKIEALFDTHYDYIIDAIDTLSPKVFLIVNAVKNNIPIISSMGAGGKFDVSKIEITDISKTHNCKLARMVRKRLSKHGIKKGVTVVYSPEKINKDFVIPVEGEQNKKTTVGTISYMPATFGIFAAAHVIRRIANV